MGLKFAVTYPRSGSHLMGKVYGMKDYAARKTHPKPTYKRLDKFRDRVKDNIWIHYPYDPDLVDTLKRQGIDCYILLRDPRDIIVSLARYVYDHPGTFPNYYYVPNEKLSDYEFETRVDILITAAYYDMLDYDKYRRIAGFEPIYFKDLLKKPDAKTYTKYKVRGIVGGYKEDMTPLQITRANDRYSELIEVWKN